MSTSTHYKDRFKDTWKISALKESRVRRAVTRCTSREVVPTGFGSGTDEYIPGSSSDHGHDKAEPDFAVVGTPVRIEVSGPLKQLDNGADLWINETKLKYAEENWELEYWFAHVNGPGGPIRMIPFDLKFWSRHQKNRIRTVNIEKRGIPYTFYVLSPKDPLVYSITEFQDYIHAKFG